MLGMLSYSSLGLVAVFTIGCGAKTAEPLGTKHDLGGLPDLGGQHKDSGAAPGDGAATDDDGGEVVVTGDDASVDDMDVVAHDMQVTHNDGGTHRDGSTQHDGSTHHDAAATDGGLSVCGSCVQTQCSSQLTACSNSANCSGLLNCLVMMNCATQACANNCVSAQANPTEAVTLFNAIFDCRDAQCSAECGGTMMSVDAGVDGGRSPCSSCVQMSCSSEEAACFTDPGTMGCATLRHCLTGCGSNNSCRSTCYGHASASAVTKSKAYGVCAGSAIANECAGVCN